MLLMHIAFRGEILIPAPGWVSYEPQAQIGSNKVHWLETSRENNWSPTAIELEKKVTKIGKKKIKDSFLKHQTKNQEKYVII